MCYGLVQAGGQDREMDRTHGDFATIKSSHQARTSARQTIFFTHVLLALLTMVVELSLCTGALKAMELVVDLILPAKTFREASRMSQSHNVS